MSVRSYLSNSAETLEMHPYPKLRSRYYKTNYQKAKTAILDFVKTINAEIRNIDDAHKEIYVQSKRFHIIFTITQVNPIETSIDLKVEQYGLIGAHKPRKMIMGCYEFLDTKLPFKGVSLHP